MRRMKAFQLAWPILRTVPAVSETGAILPTASAESLLADIASYFPLPRSVL